MRILKYLFRKIFSKIEINIRFFHNYNVNKILFTFNSNASEINHVHYIYLSAWLFFNHKIGTEILMFSYILRG